MTASDMGLVGEMVHEDVVAGGSSAHSIFAFYGVPAWIHTPTPHTLVMNCTPKCRFTRRFCLIYLIMTFRWSIRALFGGVYIHISAGLRVK